MASDTTLPRRLRWAVPAVAAAVVGAAVVLPSTFASAGSPDLPERTAAQLLADVAGADVTALSGTVVQTARLGLPELPETTGSGTGPMALTNGSNTLRVWYDGPQRVRVALLGELAEYDAVRNGRDLWTYSSEKDEAVHVELPAGHGGEAAKAPPGSLPMPAEAAEAALAAIEPSTEVRVDSTARVADRDAYQLVLDPRDEQSLVGSVRLAVDAETSVPLRVQVWSSRDGSTPAFEIGFTDVSFDRPDASVFDFVPPAGATVREVAPPAGGTGGDGPAEQPGDGTGELPGTRRPGAGGPPVEVLGSGWTSVLVVPGLAPAELASEDAAGLLESLTTRVPEGRLLSTALLTVLLTDDGRVLVGAVPADVLREAATR